MTYQMMGSVEGKRLDPGHYAGERSLHSEQIHSDTHLSAQAVWERFNEMWGGDVFDQVNKNCHHWCADFFEKLTQRRHP